MAIDQGFAFKILPVLGAVLALTSIMVSYEIALKQGHVKPFPKTNISACAVHYPEYIVFRTGIIIACTIIAFALFIIPWWFQLLNEQFQAGINIKIKKLRVLGILAPFFLQFGTGLLSDGPDMHSNLHVLGATGFFLILLYLFVLYSEIIKKLWAKQPGFIATWSYIFKANIKYYAVVLLSLAILDKIFHKQLKKYEIGNWVEWIATGLVMVYLMTFSFDMNKVAVYMTPKSQSTTRKIKDDNCLLNSSQQHINN